ncbi:SGNH/GDSL hydrolase family protein [Providencia rettgeri]|uniref:SGNH/GDSL hydrolase family protein n=1 Tax=Providencia rettgeri TaxID=587 RepID=UPI0014199B7E|nr:SGNH/GDSL hydrolase family protein [Providencia rettgeri]NIH07065.1 SGNH/GDSL hydrolase family protein [Providencia rettgeri]
MRIILFFSILIFSFPALSKVLFFGDSLTYVIGNEYKKNNTNTDIIYNVGFSFISNHEYMFDYIESSNLKKYDKIFIVFGTNDFINEKDINNYSVLCFLFINRILHYNANLEITWILPPTIKDTRKNILLGNTKIAIKNSMNAAGIKIIDPDIVFGVDYRQKIGNKAIRTADGVHITNYGANLIVNFINKEFKNG